MSAYPDLRPSTLGHWPPRLQSLPRNVPILGEHIGLHRGTLVGWTDRPEASWSPTDLLWTPPGAKSIDEAGEIVDVKTFANVPGHVWVTAQLARRDRYLEVIRRRVQAGEYKLTAAMARLLGLPEDGALLTDAATAEWAALRDMLERTA